MPSNQLVLQFSTTSSFGWSLKWKNRWSWIIRKAGHTQFSHVDIQTKDGLLGASDNLPAPIIKTTPPGNPRGVAVRPSNYQLFGYRRQMVLETPRADDIIGLAWSQLGKAFDNGFVKNFMSDAFPGARDWRLDDCWFCGELVAWALETGGFWADAFPDGRLPWPKNRVSPTDLLLVLLTDRRWVNRDTFWLPVPGLQLDPGEI